MAVVLAGCGANVPCTVSPADVIAVRERAAALEEQLAQLEGDLDAAADELQQEEERSAELTAQLKALEESRAKKPKPSRKKK